MTDFVSKHFPFIPKQLFEKYNFQARERKYDSEHFGNAYLIVANSQLEIRFIKDRSQYFIDIRSPKDTVWHQFVRMVEFLKLVDDQCIDIRKQLALFEDHYDQICAVFNDAVQNKKFNEFEALGNKQQMDRIFNKA